MQLEDRAMANAARMYQVTGNQEAAIKIWTELSNSPKSSFGPEAKIRLPGS